MVKAFERTEEVLLDRVAEQMSQGRTGNDQPIVSPYTGLDHYAPATIRFKKEFGIGLGKVTDRITLFMTGRHYKGLYSKVSGEALVIGSDVEYQPGGFKGSFGELNTNLYQPGTEQGQEYIDRELSPAFYDEMMQQLNK